MTEQEWVTCADPTPMLGFLRDKASERKLRLFAVACCCRILRLFTDQRSVNAVLVADRYLDGTASREELIEAGRAARRAYENAFQTHDNAAFAAVLLAIDDPYHAANGTAAYAAYWDGHELAAGGGSQAEIHDNYTAGHVSEQEAQAALLRHMVGDPFRPFPTPASCSSTVIQVAAALYDGQDCGFALYDALLEAGHPELAEHFGRRDGDEQAQDTAPSNTSNHGKAP